MKFICILTCLSFLFSPVNAFSSEPTGKIPLPVIDVPADEKDVGAAISPLRKSVRAPFTGVLLSPLAVATLIADMSAQEKLLELELSRLRHEHAADLQFNLEKQKIQYDADREIFNAQLQSKTSLISSLEKQLEKEINDRPNLFFWTSLGVVAGISITVLTTFALTQVQN